MWWRPTWQDMLRHVGWRWIFALPALGVVVWLFACAAHPELLRIVLYLGIKGAIMALALPAVLIGYLVREATAARTDPFCIHCGYSLVGLGEEAGTCPECGRPYTRQVIEEYRRDPQWFIARYRAHGQLPPPAQRFDAGLVRRKRSRDGT